MARNIREIYNEIIIAKENNEQLDMLVNGYSPEDSKGQDYSQELISAANSPSKVAEWKLIYWVVAFAIWTHEQLWEVFFKKAEALEKASKIGSLEWYKKKILEYDGWKDSEGNNVIQFVSLEEVEGLIKIKIAGQNRNNLDPDLPIPPVESDPDYETKQEEYLAIERLKNGFNHFKNFFDQEIRLAGIQTSITSHDADIVKVKYDIYYNPKMSLQEDKTARDILMERIEEKLNEFQRNDMPYNGILSLTKLTDALQQVEDIISPVLDEAYYINILNTDEDGNTTEKSVEIEEFYRPLSGAIDIEIIVEESSFIPYNTLTNSDNTDLTFSYEIGVNSLFKNLIDINTLKDKVSKNVREYVTGLTQGSKLKLSEVEEKIRSYLLIDPELEIVSFDQNNYLNRLKDFSNLYSTLKSESEAIVVEPDINKYRASSDVNIYEHGVTVTDVGYFNVNNLTGNPTKITSFYIDEIKDGTLLAIAYDLIKEKPNIDTITEEDVFKLLVPFRKYDISNESKTFITMESFISDKNEKYLKAQDGTIHHFILEKGMYGHLNTYIYQYIRAANSKYIQNNEKGYHRAKYKYIDDYSGIQIAFNIEAITYRIRQVYKEASIGIDMNNNPIFYEKLYLMDLESYTNRINRKVYFTEKVNEYERYLLEKISENDNLDIFNLNAIDILYSSSQALAGVEGGTLSSVNYPDRLDRTENKSYLLKSRKISHKISPPNIVEYNNLEDISVLDSKFIEDNISEEYKVHLI
ncbi:hypothetical protein [Aureibacter tunicatorum]|uniref:Uncharacterized protein n=1 Tax=Aureibacter tunicatorum TaxID=866807 RepID=A0AAE4BVD1_9BACT|nr:hypothetical protein [Aureibacter tunicatorum]MDR6241960.1 hypothetical protein [Aureibacter tunicatorum]BDD07513.1 hypothetical protein AUTU_49960 [Aureibacter tunicatorum]